MTDTDRACFSHWWPVVKDLSFTPETQWVEHHVGLREIDESTERLDKLAAKLQEMGESLGGTPLFLRSGQTSGKHDWENTCAVKDLGEIKSHILSIIEYSHIAAVPGLPTNVWVLREWLNIDAEFRAFNGTPIGHEWRYFVEDGEITHRQPYWPEDAIKDASTGSWEIYLTATHSTSDVDRAESIAKYTADRIALSDRLSGEWSVDVARTESGWYMIDMAPGEVSYRWGP